MRTLSDPTPLVIVMVGLPARGKTFLARKIVRYLTWLGREAQIFNVGNYRRDRLGSQQPASFFDPANEAGRASREALALAALDDLTAWVTAGEGRVAVYDATNATRARRDAVEGRLANAGLRPLFVESVCTDPELVEANIRESKLSMPDYAGIDAEQAVRDFRARIGHYERAYEPLAEEQRSFVRLIDVGRRVEMNRVEGGLASQVVFFLTNLHITPRPLLLMRHGESEYNALHRIGGDSGLTARGQRFGAALSTVLPELVPSPPVVFTSTLRRTVQTASNLTWPRTALKNLDEIDAGRFDGWTYDAIEANAPDDWSARKADKLRYRYPRGESYLDLIQRLEPVIVEMERRREPVVVIAHQAVIRCLVAYFTDQSMEACPRLEVSLHTIIELVPKAYGPVERRVEVPVDGR
jgi:broad specificity phosphatase PhoE